MEGPGIPGIVEPPFGSRDIVRQLSSEGAPKLVVAPGVEYLKESGDREGILRLGLMYAFPAGKIHLEPSVFWDVTQEGGTWVWGLTIGKEF